MENISTSAISIKGNINLSEVFNKLLAISWIQRQNNKYAFKRIVLNNCNISSTKKIAQLWYQSALFNKNI